MLTEFKARKCLLQRKRKESNGIRELSHESIQAESGVFIVIKIGLANANSI